MATTSIWAVKDDLQRVLNYITNSQKTKNPDYSEFEYQGLENAIDYVVDDFKTEKQFYVSGINCEVSSAYEQMTMTKKASQKEGGVLAFHGYQSFMPGEVSAEVAHQIGVELAQQMWGDDFEVVVSTHLDHAHFHNHFVVNSVSWITRKRFLNQHKDYARLRSLSDELCRKYKLSVIENPKKGKHYAQWQAEQQRLPTIRSIIQEDVDRAILNARTFTQFIKYMSDLGYRVKTDVKHIAVKPPGAKNFFRLHNLTKDEAYSEENIKERILNNVFTDNTVYKSHIKKYKYHGNIKKSKKLTGLRALYFHYMYRMGIIPNHAPQNKKVHFIFRKELRYMDKISNEATLLCRNRINTLEELNEKENELNEKLDKLIKERRCFYNKINRCKNPESKKLLQKDVETLSSEIKELRKEVRLCEDIRKRSSSMKDKLDMVKEDEKSVQKVEKRKEMYSQK